jgi:predicted aspartyl protease
LISFFSLDNNIEQGFFAPPLQNSTNQFIFHKPQQLKTMILSKRIPLTFLALALLLWTTDAFAPPHLSTGSFTTTRLYATSRRQALGSGGVMLGSIFGGKNEQAKAAEDNKNGLLADLPMIRLKLPKEALGREYVGLQLTIDGKGPFDFMVDTGLTTEMITPHLQQSLGIATGQNQIRGLGAGGTTSNSLVPLKGASLCCGTFANPQQPAFPLPTLTAVVTDFPQEHIDPAHDPVEGMLGMEVLSLFDLDLDFPAGRLRLWKPGTAETAAKQTGMVEIPAVVINESGLYGIRVSAPGCQQPVLGFIDCGATFSALNWAAAGYLGLPAKTDRKAYADSPAVTAIGIDGKPLLLPTRKADLSFVGDAQKDPTTGGFSFQPPPSNWRPWDSVQVAIGDLPVFRDLLGDGIRPYEGPACLIGLDILAQRRVILETGETRKRRLWVDPK